MKRILLFLLLYTSLFGQFNKDREPETLWNAETFAHKQRVEADGSTIFDIHALNQEILKSKIDGSWDKYASWPSAIYGVKKDASGYISKVYSVKGASGDLIQSTGASQPLYVANGQNGKPVIRFDGNNDNLKTASMTLNQPTVIYIAVKQLSWTMYDYIFDGYTNLGGIMVQRGVSPNVDIYAGEYISEGATSLTIGTTKLVKVVFNGASSSIGINNTELKTGSAGSASMNGLTVGGAASVVTYCSNIEVCEIRVLNSLPTSQQDTNIKNSINNTWGLY